MLRVSVFGIGYVGAVTAACLARDGHRVVAVDIDDNKVNAIAAGQSPIVEPGLDELIASEVRCGRLTPQKMPSRRRLETDISLICVGTPANGNGSLDTTQVKRVADEIGRVLAGKNGYHLIVVRSTVLPGTTEDVLLPAIEQASGKRVHDDFGIAHMPEFMREGAAIADYDQSGADCPRASKTTAHATCSLNSIRTHRSRRG